MAQKNLTLDKFVSRFRVIFYIFLCIGIVAVLYMLYLQYLTKDSFSTDDIYREETIPYNRGSILAHDGKPLAISVPSYEVRWDSNVVSDSIFEADGYKLAKELALYFKDKNANKYHKELKEARSKKNRYHRITSIKIDQTEVETIKSFPIFKLGQNLGGIILIDKTRRMYPYGKLAYRTVGYINDGAAGTGIESSHNHILSGEDGKEVIYRTSGGNWIRANGEPYIAPVNGYDIRTTLDIYIQEAAETELKKALMESDIFVGGTAIVMEVATGAIRACANMHKGKNGKFDETYNYAISHATEPGSTLKLAALIALIEDGNLTLEDSVDTGTGLWIYHEAKIRDTRKGGYGVLTLKEAFEKSSNIAFAKFVVDAFEKRPTDYVEKLHSMKLVERLNLDINGEGTATITSPEDKLWSMSSLTSLGYGYATTLTPMHTLTFYNAIANKGKMMRPYFIESFERDSIVYEKFKPTVVSGSICNKKSIEYAHEALVGVIENGTGKNLKNPYYQIAAKTGTARIALEGGGYGDDNHKRHQASLAGYFPADNPEYSCIVVLYTGTMSGDAYGATYAGPVFKGIADKIYATHPHWHDPIEKVTSAAIDNPVIAPGIASELATGFDYLKMKERPKMEGRGWVSIKEGETGLTGENMTIEPGVMPDIIGMGLKDALFLLENEGYVVTFDGSGKIYKQIPQKGTPLNKGDRVTIYLK